MTNLTTLELQVLEAIDQSEYGDNLCDAIWFWAGDMAADLGITAKAVGGVVTSLQEKGFVHVYIATARERRMGEDSTINMTEAGIKAYVAAKPDHKKPVA
jgi:DNA-binding MarR family transcriptional regulator